MDTQNIRSRAEQLILSFYLIYGNLKEFSKFTVHKSRHLYFGFKRLKETQIENESKMQLNCNVWGTQKRLFIVGKIIQRQNWAKNNFNAIRKKTMANSIIFQCSKKNSQK